MTNIEQMKKVVLLAKDGKYFDIMRYDFIDEFATFLQKYDVWVNFVSGWGLTEVWEVSCGLRQLRNLSIEFNRYQLSDTKEEEK